MPSILHHLLITCFLLLCITGCSLSSSPESSATIPATLSSSTSHESEAISSTPTLTSEPVETQLFDLTTIEGPVLLLQTDFDQYRYLNPVSQVYIPFQPPIADPQFRLQTKLSPSGKQMFFPLDEHSGIIKDLRTGKTVHTFDYAGPALFDPDLSATEAAPLVSELELNEVGLLEAVREAHQRSKSLLFWYQSDRYHLFVQDTGPTSTSLFLEDHQAGTRTQLENQPGMVESVQIGPDGSTILLKKDLVIEPGAYRDDRYYLLYTQNHTTQELSLPDEVQNPSVTWFDHDRIAVVHQTYMSGGSGFSIIDLNSMETRQIITGEFLDLRQFGSHLFFLQRADDPERTMFQLLTLEGVPVASKTIDQRCFYQFAVSNRLIYQCGLESFLLDQTLNIEPFIDSVLTLSPAPDGSAIVMLNRDEHSFLLDANLHIQYELPLEEAPLEIKWLPDSSGFLYRTRGKLFYFDLANRSSSLLIKSDLFSDYINLNAVWVNLE